MKAERRMPITRQRHQLRGNDVHAWVLDLQANADEVRGYAEWLSADEHARSEQYRQTRDRDHFIVRRGKLREVLGGYLDQSPGQLRFGRSDHGKPHLVMPAADIRFSVSHSGDVAVFGFALGHELGVDVERMRDDIDVEQIASVFFSATEQAQLGELTTDRHREGFYRSWSCKEAFVKSLGTGLSHPLHDFDVEVDPSEPACLLATRPDKAEAGLWSLHAFIARSDYCVAVAARCRDWNLTVFDDSRDPALA